MSLFQQKRSTAFAQACHGCRISRCPTATGPLNPHQPRRSGCSLSSCISSHRRPMCCCTSSTHQGSCRTIPTTSYTTATGALNHPQPTSYDSVYKVACLCSLTGCISFSTNAAICCCTSYIRESSRTIPSRCKSTRTVRRSRASSSCCLPSALNCRQSTRIGIQDASKISSICSATCRTTIYGFL